MRIILNLSAVLILACCTTVAAHAQLGVGVGAQGGLLLSSRTYAGGVLNRDVSNVTGFTFGVPVEIVMLGPFALQPELNYLRRGVKFDYVNGATITITEEQRLNYVELPILLKVGITGERFVAALVAGPSFGYAVSGTETIRTTVANIVTTTEEDPFDNFKRRDIVGIVGAQAGIPFGSGKLIADARYRFGISNLMDNNQSVNVEEVKSKGFSLTAGYMITFGNY